MQDDTRTKPDPAAALSAARIAERYGVGHEGAFAAHEVIAHLLAHRSVRAYLPTPLPDGTIAALVAAAQSASSSSNLQTWSVIAVADPDRKGALAALAGSQAHIFEAPLFLVWLADFSRLEAAARAHGIAPEALDYLEMMLVGCIDAALAAQNAAVAAEALGMGIVYIGGMRNQPLEVARILELPPRTFAVFGMCVGYPDPERPAAVKPRLNQGAVLHRETYGGTEPDAHIADYDGIMDGFYASQGLANDPWSLHSAKRVRGPQSLSGRDKLRAALEAMGFVLK